MLVDDQRLTMQEAIGFLPNVVSCIPVHSTLDVYMKPESMHSRSRLDEGIEDVDEHLILFLLDDYHKCYMFTNK